MTSFLRDSCSTPKTDPKSTFFSPRSSVVAHGNDPLDVFSCQRKLFSTNPTSDFSVGRLYQKKVKWESQNLASKSQHRPTGIADTNKSFIDRVENFWNIFFCLPPFSEIKFVRLNNNYIPNSPYVELCVCVPLEIWDFMLQTPNKCIIVGMMRVYFK